MYTEIRANGYMGKYFRVDLSNEKITTTTFDRKILRKYIGGRGLGVYILHKELPKDLINFNPLGEDNVIAIMTGPYTGTAAPASARFDVVTLSPHTKLLGASNAGGFFGPALKRSGFDGIIITGKSEEPVYITCIEGEYGIKSAKNLWGKDTYSSENIIKEELGNKKLRTLIVGPAGEKGVTFSGLINDQGRSASRSGAGAVFGSKNLKGIAVYGTNKIEVAFPEKFKAQVQQYIRSFKKDPAGQAFQLNGTSMAIQLEMMLGGVPVQNYTRGHFDKMTNLCAKRQWETTLVDHHACQGCILSCKRKVAIETGKYKLETNPASGPEYEAIGALGTNLLIDDIYAVTKANDYCNRMGIDVISAGTVIAYVIECYRRCLISKEELNGIEPDWGDADAMLALLNLIGERRGIGKLLSTGVKRASKEIEGSKKYAVHVKGLEVPMHDPRANFVMGLHYATTPFGAHHTSAADAVMIGIAPIPNEDLDFEAKPDKRALDRLSPIGKARTLITIQDRSFMMDSMGICDFVFMALSTPARFISAMLALTTGWSMKYREQFLKTGERIANLCRAFNLRCGLKPSDDRLPYRLLKEAHPDGGSKGALVNLAPMLREYYKLRDWNLKTGRPSQAKLKELGLIDVLNELYG
jgi:aldehyde:ferredoxin oxidoreductase